MIVETLFPGASSYGRGGNEANGLHKLSIPQNCFIISNFHDNHYPVDTRREHYLVVVGSTLISLRICQAAEGCGYPEFAAIMGTANTEEEKTELRNQFYRWKKSFNLELNPPKKWSYLLMSPVLY